MNILFLVTTGEYTQPNIICAFADEDQAMLFAQQYRDNPPRTFGPVAPVRITPLDVYDTVAEAVVGELDT